MKTATFIVQSALFLAFGLFFISCAKLNPNTEGQIVSALQTKQGVFKSCYQAALERNRETKGTMGLMLKIHETTGQVTSSEIEQSTIADEAMKTCVAGAASDIALTEPPGVPVEGHYDIAFNFE